MNGMTQEQVESYIGLLRSQIDEEEATRQALKDQGDEALAFHYKAFASAFVRALFLFQQVLGEGEADRRR